MSEETPQKLRLKPRVATEAAPAPTPAAPATVAPPPSSAALARPKMRLGAEPVVPSPAEADSAGAGVPVPGVPLATPAPDFSVGDAAPGLEVSGDSRVKFSLRPREAAAEPAKAPPVPGASASTPAVDPATLLFAPPPKAPVGIPVADSVSPGSASQAEPPVIAAMPAAPQFPPPPAPAPSVGQLPPPPRVASAAPMPVGGKAAADPKKARRKRLVLLSSLLGVIVAAALAGGAWMLLDVPEPPEIVRPRVVAPAKPTVVPSPPAAPANTGPISQAKAVVAQVQAQQGEPAREVIKAASEESGGASGPAILDPGQTKAPQVSLPAPAVHAPMVGPVPSDSFKEWVREAKISGVRAGANPRVFIERTAYGVGDLVNPQLGIAFDGYNAETRLLRFKDASGATLERRH